MEKNDKATFLLWEKLKNQKWSSNYGWWKKGQVKSLKKYQVRKKNPISRKTCLNE